MGKTRFVKFHLDLLSELDNYHPAVVLYGYLELCQANRYIPKDRDGYFERSSAQLLNEVHLKRTTQDNARRVLRKYGHIRCKLGDGRSPTTKYRIVERRK